MRRQMRRLVIAMVLLFGLLGNHSIAYANTSVEEGISVSVETDKSAYEKNEEITIETTVKNLKGVSIHDFSLENLIPDGFKLSNGTKKDFIQKELKPGEEIVLLTTIVEGKDNTGLVIGIVLIVVLAGAIGTLFVLKKKKQAIAAMLVLVMGISTFGPYGVAIVQAKEERTLSKESILNYDSKDVQLLTKVDYEEEVPVSNEADTITKGEWIKLLLEKNEIALLEKESEFTYYFTDTKDSECGLAVETAYSRGYLPQQDSNVFGIDEAADREFVAYTVYAAMGFCGEYTLECIDLAEIRYGNECALLIQQGFLSLIDGKFMPKNALTTYDKEQILNKIAYFNDSMDLFSMEEVYEVEYVDGVVLLETESYDCIESEEKCRLVLSADVDVSKLKNDTVFVITEKQPYEMSEAFKVVSLQVEDGKITMECTRPQLDEVLEEYRMVGSTYLDPESIIPEEGIEVEYIPNNTQVASLGGFRVEDSIDSLGTVKFNIATLNLGKESGITLQGEFSIEIPEIAFLVDGKGMSLDELTINVSSEENFTGLKLGWSSAMDEEGRITEEKVKIATFPSVPVALGASVKVTLYLEIGVSGEISLSWAMESLNGIQYKDKVFRTISDTTKTTSGVKINAKMKVGAAPNIALLMFGIWDVAGLDTRLGLAGEISKSTHEDIVPKLECLDVGVYVYLNLKIDEESAIGKLLKAAKISASRDVWKSTNSPWKSAYHIENNELKDACTYGKGHIFGSIIDENGKAVQNARVVITREDGTYRAETQSAVTQSDEYKVGDFGFENIPIGEYKIEVSLDTLYAGSATVTVESGKRAECWNIVLKEISSSGESNPTPVPESTPNPTPTPNPDPTPEPNYEGYQVSTQGYDYAKQVSEKYYVVGNGELYGMADYNGNVVVPIQYKDYKMVAEDEVEFRENDGSGYAAAYSKAYVYNTKNGALILKYVVAEYIESSYEPYETITVQDEIHKFYIGNNPLLGMWDEILCRDYQNGILMESYDVIDICDSYTDCGGVATRTKVTCKNVSNDSILYNGYSTRYPFSGTLFYGDGRNVYYEYEGEPVFYKFSSNWTESIAVMLEYSIQEQKYYLVKIDKKGATRKVMSDISCFENTSIQYNNGWIKMPYTSKLMEFSTMEMSSMPFNYGAATSWIFGRGEYYAVSTDNGENNTYSICKGSTILKNGCLSVDFNVGNNNYIVYERSDGKFVYMNYSGKDLMTVNDYGDFVNGRAIVNDGTGIYMIDENLNKVSDYIYKGTVDNCYSGAIKINGKYYLIGKN